ncbi:MAG: Gfo/Idh/MocA family oxidoreductase [Bacteroidota bacterium]
MPSNSKQNFALIGTAGYIAPRHLAAIHETNNTLVAAYDPSDSVGILDRYFPKASFFTEFERFDRHLDKLKRQGTNIDYLTICSPNYLHDAHIRFGLRIGAKVICEKPLVINPWNAKALMEQDENEDVFTILQLRHHPTIKALKAKVEQSDDKIYDIDLTYITARGKWYYASWKGDESRSGGIAANIGIHFFDMLLWIFGSVKENQVHRYHHDSAAGYLELERARVKWFLSINGDHIDQKDRTVQRSIKIDSEEIDFTTGFTDLHLESYRQILAGKGYSIKESLSAIELVRQIRTAELSDTNKKTTKTPPKAKLPLTKHPFKNNPQNPNS